MTGDRLGQEINLSVCSRIFGWIVLTLLLSGCSHDPSSVQVKELRLPPKVVSGSHIVRGGETLFSIAWLYSRDYKELAAVNGIRSPYTIFPGQHINLTSSSYVSHSPGPVIKSTTISSKSAAVKKTTVKMPVKVERSSSISSWRWPANGKVVQGYHNGNGLNKGIDIRGKLGEPVSAAAAGEVVYAGSELAGYGKLIIMKHNNSYLSAYAHNKELLVREGDSVKAGQKIAEIGSTGTTEPKLHFEIRHNGKPVDPMRFLPVR
ncbi:peptidoglycan DD-metalloendopeptidase family protein [Endozoicomonas sp. ALB032]|uniref:peptidoglycan DD-metalloendopeptidase family protein n=1 Tax=Endozoicomonas sp. ALB032 TaxID=3403082 RepID=UPI003BB7B0A1